jgi:hypothetical protein
MGTAKSDRALLGPRLKQRTPPKADTSQIDMKNAFGMLAVMCKKNNRHDKTAIELFLAEVRGWESGLQRRFNDAKPIAT